ncbi:hypothetical protein [Novispirillum itersonii]|uniref:hypothetical protein n=1 Tax=Novispirillum itersonii TaxID=189 RepID=UPI00036754D3|nr:hypothetical protein [Novispirillum itersonii]
MTIRVPTLTTRTVEGQVLQAPMMQARVSSADGGGLAAQGMINAGQQVQDLGSAISQHALKMAVDDAKTEAMAAYNDWQTQRLDLLEGDEKGYFRLTGEAAYRGAEGINTALKTAWETRAGTISSRARKMIEPQILQDLQRDALSVARHAASGRDAWQDRTAQATAQGMAAEAARFFADPDRRETALNTGRAAIFERAAQRGWSIGDQRLKAEIAAFDSSALTGVLRKYAETDPQGARAYFETVKGRLSPADASAMVALLDHRGMLHAVDTAVQGIRAVPWNGDGQPSPQEIWDRQRAEAEKIADPSVRAGAQAILERDFRLAEAAATQRRKAGQEEIYAQVAKGLNPATLPPEVQQVIGADFVSQMQGLYQNNGKAPYDPALEGALQKASLDKDTFAQIDLTALRGRHDNGRLDYWIDQQRAMTSADPKDVARQTMRQPVYGMGLSIVQQQFPVADGSDLMAVERQARAAGQTRAFIDTFMDEKGQPPSEGDLYRFTRTLKNGAAGDRTGGFGWRGINPAVIAQSPWGGAVMPIADKRQAGTGAAKTQTATGAENQNDLVKSWGTATPKERIQIYAKMNNDGRKAVFDLMSPEEREKTALDDILGNEYRPPVSKEGYFKDKNQIENWQNFYQEVRSTQGLSEARQISLLFLYALEGGNAADGEAFDENGRKRNRTSSGIQPGTLADYNKKNKDDEINSIIDPVELKIKHRIKVMNWYIDGALTSEGELLKLDDLGDPLLAAAVEDTLYRHGSGPNGGPAVINRTIDDLAGAYNASLPEPKKGLTVNETTPGFGKNSFKYVKWMTRDPKMRDRFLNRLADNRIDALKKKKLFGGGDIERVNWYRPNRYSKKLYLD